GSAANRAASGADPGVSRGGSPVTLVVDASTVVAALVDSGTDGRWAESLLTSDSLAAPHLLSAEASNILRRSALARTISAEEAALAPADLPDLPMPVVPYAPFAP